jgi:hypothetical protein
MADEVSDLLDRHTLLAHDRDERVAQPAWSPIAADSTVLAELLEGPSHVRRVQRRPCCVVNTSPLSCPARPGDQPFLRLPSPVRLQRLNGRERQPQRPP